MAVNLYPQLKKSTFLWKTSLLCILNCLEVFSSAILVHAAINANTFIIGGNGDRKGNIFIDTVELTELAPGIIEQLSPESLDRLRQMADAYLKMTQNGISLNESQLPDLLDNYKP